MELGGRRSGAMYEPARECAGGFAVHVGDLTGDDRGVAAETSWSSRPARPGRSPTRRGRCEASSSVDHMEVIPETN